MGVVVAPATPWGRSALAVVRLSGAGLDEVLRGFVRPHNDGPWHPNRVRRVDVFDEGGVFDDGMVVVSRAPATFTGEDTAELTVHGNPIIVERVLHAAVAAGARMATAGEFTRRALQNGKMDLLQAEAVLQVIHATSEQGLKIGRDAMEGRLGAVVGSMRGDLLEVAAELEARLDYPGDELAKVDDAELLITLGSASARARDLAATFGAGRMYVEGARVALVGPVNAGKSSLFNALVGSRRALVHDREGTTRDVLEVSTMIGGLQVTLMDTAGERQTDDPIEAAGLALAAELIEGADLLVVVLRARGAGLSEVEQQILDRTGHRRRLVVYNGTDRPGMAPAPHGAIPTSAKAGEGIEALKDAMRTVLVGAPTKAGELVVGSARQRDVLLALADCLDEAIEALPWAGVAVSADAVTRGIEQLDQLTGEDTRERVLDALFSRFCIGK